MRRCLRLLVLVAVVGLGLLWAGPARADSGRSGLDIAVRATDPLAPVVVLTNRTGSAVPGLAAATGTVSLDRWSPRTAGRRPRSPSSPTTTTTSPSRSGREPARARAGRVGGVAAAGGSGRIHRPCDRDRLLVDPELTVGALYPVEAGKTPEAAGPVRITGDPGRPDRHCARRDRTLATPAAGGSRGCAGSSSPPRPSYCSWWCWPWCCCCGDGGGRPRWPPPPRRGRAGRARRRPPAAGRRDHQPRR